MWLSSILSRSMLVRLIQLSIGLLVISCSGNPVDDNTKPTGPALLSVIPANAPPGATLAISGATVDTSALASYRLLIGGQQTALLTDTLGRVLGIAPAFFKDTTAIWPSPSATPLDIELFKDTVLVGRGVGIFTSDSLIQVPGSTLKLVNNTIATVESYKSILAALPTEPGIQEQLTFAMTAALDSLMYGRGDSSLTALLTELQANNPEALALLDATYGSDGSAERSQEIADAMAAIAASLNSGVLRRGQAIPADVRLAAQMQLSSLLKLFGDSFIHGAASTSSDIAFGASWAAFSGAAAVPGAQVVILFASVTSTVLSMVDLIFNKILVASMPTVIDSFTITFNIDTIAVGDTTVSSLKVYARNSPPQITLGDLLSQFQGIMGLVAPGGGATMLQQLEGTLNYLLGQLNNALQAYATANPDFSYEPIFFDIAGVPIIHWEAVITDPRLLKLNKQTPRIAVIDSLLEWRSTGDPGSASVTISPSFGADATLIPIPSFLGYSGSSFGVLSDSSALVSETQPITIKKELVLFVDFAPIISQNGANGLGVKAGEIGVTGDTLYRGGLDVTLTVIGGGADPSTGTTDTLGEFVSLITLDPFSDSVEVIVRVTRITGEYAAETVRANVDNQHRSQFTVAVPGAILGVSLDGLQIDTLIANPLIGRRHYIWSPDGSKIVTQDGYVFTVGGGVQQLAEPNIAAWSPDGSTVYRSIIRNRGQPNDSVLILSVPVDGSASRVIYREKRNSDTYVDPNNSDSLITYGALTVSPNGGRIAFPRMAIKPDANSRGVRTIQTIDANGGARVELVRQVVNPQGGVYSALRWAPDDSKLAFQAFVHDAVQGTTLHEVRVLDFGTNQMVKITPAQPEGGERFNYFPIGVFPTSLDVLTSRRPSSSTTNSITQYVVFDPTTATAKATIFSGVGTSFVSSPAISGDGLSVAAIVSGSLIIKDALGSTVGQTAGTLNMVVPRWRP